MIKRPFIFLTVLFIVCLAFFVLWPQSSGSQSADTSMTVKEAKTVRSNGSPSGTLSAGTTQTTLSLNTAEAGTCRYSTVADTPYALMTDTFSVTGGTAHSQTITGLSDGNAYTYYVRCRDDEAVVNTDDYSLSFSVASPVLGGGGGAVAFFLLADNPPALPAAEPEIPAAPDVEETDTQKVIEVIKKIPEVIQKIPEVIKKIPEVIQKIPEIFKSEPAEVAPEITATEELMSKAISILIQKFPELENSLKEAGITSITDIEKIKSAKLTLPGLTESLGWPAIAANFGKPALIKGVPLAELSLEVKQQLPTGVVFVRTAGELIDFNIALTVSEAGELQQKITTISGQLLQLAIKPDQPVKSIRGYLVFKSMKIGSSPLVPLVRQLAGSFIFTNPVLAYAQADAAVVGKLVPLEFDYVDPDNDGIYTAEIQVPLIEGEYDLVTVMDYAAPELAEKEIKLIIVVDPEGYIYERNKNKETRIPGAVVSIYWLNLETGEYELWPAWEYQQENPKITDATGKYSFFVPEGSYYLQVEAPDYLIYTGKPFQIKEGNGVHVNIELKTRYWWLKAIDWKITLIIMAIILLSYGYFSNVIRRKFFQSKNQRNPE